MLLITCQNLFELYTLCIISIQYMQEPICFCGGLVIWGQQNSKFVCCGNRIKVRLNEVWGEKTVCFACGRVKVKFKYLICGLSCVQSENLKGFRLDISVLAQIGYIILTLTNHFLLPHRMTKLQWTLWLVLPTSDPTSFSFLRSQGLMSNVSYVISQCFRTILL